MGFHFHSFLKENIHRTDFRWHIRTAVSICQHSRHSMIKATGKGSKKINWLATKQMPIWVRFKCARRDGGRPTAGWMDRGCLKGIEQRQWPVKFQRDVIGMVTRIKREVGLSQRLLILRANQAVLSFILQSSYVTWNLSSSSKEHKPSPSIPSPAKNEAHWAWGKPGF